MAKWQYEIRKLGVIEGENLGNSIKMELNSMGKDGWEMVSVAPLQIKDLTNYVAFFKRPA